MNVLRYMGLEETTIENVLIISGSRSFENGHEGFLKDYVSPTLKERDIDLVVCGDARGIDFQMIESIKWCPVQIWYPSVNGLRWKVIEPLSIEPVAVDGGTHRSCYIIRDKAMVDFYANYNTYFLGCWDGESRGTYKTAEFVKEAGIKGKLINYKDKKVLTINGG